MKLDWPLLRKENATEKEVMEWNPQGQKKRGVGTEQYEMKPWLLGRRGGEIKLSKNRVSLRHFVNALCSSGS
jgi:hypothetical protein